MAKAKTKPNTGKVTSKPKSPGAAGPKPQAKKPRTYVFMSKYPAHRVWMGQKCFQFAAGRFQTQDPTEATHLRKIKGCYEIRQEDIPSSGGAAEEAAAAEDSAAETEATPPPKE